MQAATHVIAAEVRLQLSSKDLQRGTLADTVGTNKPKYLTRARSGETVELESVGGITVCDLRLQVRGQVDNCDSFERTPNELHGPIQRHTNTVEVGDDTHFFTQIPQPIHKNSEMNAILSEGLTSIQSLPNILDQDFILSGVRT